MLKNCLQTTLDDIAKAKEKTLQIEHRNSPVNNTCAMHENKHIFIFIY